MRGQALGASAVQLSVGSAGQFRRYGEQGPPSRGSGHEARRGSQGASRAVPGKSGLCARGEGERVIALESW